MNYFKLTNMCRTCMATADGMTSIFAPKLNPSIDTMITAISSVQPQPDDNLPSKICTACLESLQKAFTFRKKIINTNNTFQKSKLTIPNYKQQSLTNTNSNKDDITEIVISDDSDEDSEDTTAFCNNDEDFTEVTNDNDINTPHIKDTDLKDGSVVKTNTNTNETINLSTQNPPEGKVLCPHCCNRVFSHQHSLDCHIRKAHTDKLLDCKFCDRRFIRKSAIQRHEERHIAGFPHLCKVCGRGFTMRKNFETHQLLHVIHKCEVCDKVFKTKLKLDNHAWVHTGEKLYKCRYCKVKFCNQRNLKKHLRVFH